MTIEKPATIVRELHHFPPFLLHINLQIVHVFFTLVFLLLLNRNLEISASFTVSGSRGPIGRLILLDQGQLSPRGKYLQVRLRVQRDDLLDSEKNMAAKNSCFLEVPMYIRVY